MTISADFHFGLLLCMHTGIRVGELSGLRWEDVDFTQHKIRIQRTVIRIKNQIRPLIRTLEKFQKPFCISVRRRQSIPTGKFHCQTSCFLCECFARWLRYICLELPDAWSRGLQRRYAALLKTCEIPPIKIHALRHQFSCRWVEHGFDTKSLSEILGHTSVRTTLDLYVHIQAETKRQYMNQMMEQAI